MNTIVIPYRPKRTSAGTEYRTVSAEHKKQILDQLSLYNKFYLEYRDSTDTVARNTIRQLVRNRQELPRRGQHPYGYNSMQSFTAGVLENFYQGTQRDFSNQTCLGIEIVTQLWNSWTGQPCYVFSVGADTAVVCSNNSPQVENKLFEWK